MSEKYIESAWNHALDGLTENVLGLFMTLAYSVQYSCFPDRRPVVRQLFTKDPAMLSANPYKYINERASRQRGCCSRVPSQRQPTYLPRYSTDNKLSHRRLPWGSADTWNDSEARPVNDES